MGSTPQAYGRVARWRISSKSLDRVAPNAYKRGVKFIYLSATGSGDPTRASIPLHLAVNGSLEVGHDVAVVLAGDAAEIVVGDTAQTLEGVGVPPMRELIAKLVKHKVPIYV
jgi:predicted peroxiredoxin